MYFVTGFLCIVLLLAIASEQIKKVQTWLSAKEFFRKQNSNND